MESLPRPAAPKIRTPWWTRLPTAHFDFNQNKFWVYVSRPKIGDFGDYTGFINTINGIVTRALPPLKICDFGDQSYSHRILSLFKTNLELNTYPILKLGDFSDPRYLAKNTQHAFCVLVFMLINE